MLLILGSHTYKEYDVEKDDDNPPTESDDTHGACVLWYQPTANQKESNENNWKTAGGFVYGGYVKTLVDIVRVYYNTNLLQNRKYHVIMLNWICYSQ